jgi:methylenetetrahydrofolate dehydrogenase (NADP+)/methenyltetrahydrofolate cyclohydrolase
MTARLIDGKAIARALREDIRKEVESFAPGRVTLAALEVRAGDGASTGSSASRGSGGAAVYAASQKKAAENLGIVFRHEVLTEGADQQALLRAVDDLNADPSVNGILLLRPLPPHCDAWEATTRIRPDKDVEGCHPANLGALLFGSDGLVPCTARAAVTLLESTGTDVRGLETVVVGHSEIVGKPVALMLVNDLSTVTTCHIATRNLAAHTSRADILFAGAGVPGLITGAMIKPGAVVIDIGINRVTVEENGVPVSRVVGDVEFDSASMVAGWISPVPGGVGPVTTATLMANTVQAARMQRDRR